MEDLETKACKEGPGGEVGLPAASVSLSAMGFLVMPLLWCVCVCGCLHYKNIRNVLLDQSSVLPLRHLAFRDQDAAQAHHGAVPEMCLVLL